MGVRILFRYGVFVLVPTLVIASFSFFLLRHEKERMEAAYARLGEEQAKTVAGAISISVDSMKNSVMADLRTLSGSGLPESLSAWQNRNPLVRNVFYVDPDGAVLLPPSGIGATKEEQRFHMRYAELFSGRVPWNDPGPENGFPAKAFSVPVPSAAEDRAVMQEQTGMDVPRLSESGWRPWFSDHRLYLLGWIRQWDTGAFYGAELELMAVLSRMIPLFPQALPDGISMALLDDTGTVLHQIGDREISREMSPDLMVMLHKTLPHWSVAVYLDPSAGHGAGGMFWVVAGLVLGGVIAAILIGGGLLAWQAYRNMQDAMKKTSFVAQVSHELKTPLTSIRMYAELLHEGRVPDLEKQKRFLGVIVEESARLGRLIGNILDFSRLEQGLKQYNVTETDVGAELGEQIGRMVPQVEAAGMSLALQIPDFPLMAHTDRDAFSQVVVNLVDNSVKYAATGKVLTVCAESEGPWCRISVCDNGPGIPEKDMERIFRRFERLDTSLAAEKPGTGLGLTISRQILRDLGGDLVCRPNAGGGACFVLQIPRGDADLSEESI